MFPLTNQDVDNALNALSIIDVTSATIRQIVSLAGELEKRANEKMVHLEMGNPGLPAEHEGVEAEIAALKAGVACKYPNIAGIPEIKEYGSEFLKAFLNVDVPAKGIVPTVGSMQGTFAVMMLMGQRIKGKDTILFLDPGFPAQHNQAKLLGLKQESFDIYDFRGDKLEAKIESILEKGNITALLYSNPNNPAWTNFTEAELEVIGRLCTKYDVIAMEDLAYFGMDFRKDISHPYEAPYGSSISHFTDNYVLFLSGSKIFSYAGQRIALVCMSPTVYERHYQALADFYEMPAFGDAFIYGVLYCLSSGTAHSAQFAMAEMLKKATKGELPFVEHCREYARKAERAKKIFENNGFHIVYEYDGDCKISDGFFFTIGYPGLSGKELQLELLRHGVASISLSSAGSEQPGVRVCVSMIDGDECFERLDKFLSEFNKSHSK